MSNGERDPAQLNLSERKDLFIQHLLKLESLWPSAPGELINFDGIYYHMDLDILTNWY
jgi:hypothetical protein